MTHSTLVVTQVWTAPRIVIIIEYFGNLQFSRSFRTTSLEVLLLHVILSALISLWGQLRSCRVFFLPPHQFYVILTRPRVLLSTVQKNPRARHFTRRPRRDRKKPATRTRRISHYASSDVRSFPIKPERVEQKRPGSLLWRRTPGISRKAAIIIGLKFALLTARERARAQKCTKPLNPRVHFSKRHNIMTQLPGADESGEETHREWWRRGHGRRALLFVYRDGSRVSICHAPSPRRDPRQISLGSEFEKTP